MKMKYFIVIVVFAAFSSIGYGFTLKAENEILANKYIGFGTLGLFFVAMPLFLYKESKGKKMKDYMLNEENIKKMREKERKDPED